MSNPQLKLWRNLIANDLASGLLPEEALGHFRELVSRQNQADAIVTDNDASDPSAVWRRFLVRERGLPE